MSRKSRKWLVMCLKALAHEQRVAMLGLLAQREYTLEELAATLKMPVEAAGEQLVVLRKVGLVNLRISKSHPACRVNPAVLQDFKDAIAQIDVLPVEEVDDKSWLDALNVTDFERKVLSSYIVNGRIRDLPERHKTLDVIMRWVITKFQAGIDYAEQEINTILTEYYEDYVTLRRELINYGFLKRERDGSRYWIARRDG